MAPVDCLFLIGNGGVEDGWNPVLRAIQTFDPDSDVDDSPEAANYWLTQHVYQMRQLGQLAKIDREELALHEGGPVTSDALDIYRANHAMALLGFRNAD